MRMAKDSELAKLRAEALKRQKAATRKMSRLKRQFNQMGDEVGPVVAGTGLDPRKPVAQVKRYTKAQLRSHIERLNTFIDRGTQFVGAGDRSPVSRDTWMAYKEYESARNAIIRARQADVDDIFIQPQGMTVGERRRQILGQREERARREEMLGYRRSSRNPAVNSEEVIERQPWQIPNASKLETLIGSLQKRLRPGYDDEQMSAAHDEFVAMMDRIGDDDIANAVAGLTPGQFDILWKESSFATQLGTAYEILKQRHMGKKASEEEILNDSARSEGALEMARSMIRWAKTLNR